MNNDKIFTFLMEFKGGSYVSQVEAKSPKSAIKQWSKNLNVDEIPGLEKKTKERLIADADIEKLSLIAEMTNVWCATFLIAGNLALVHLIQTENE